jgi:hypothetical protein
MSAPRGGPSAEKEALAEALKAADPEPYYSDTVGDAAYYGMFAEALIAAGWRDTPPTERNAPITVEALAEALRFGVDTESVEAAQAFRESIARRLLASEWFAQVEAAVRERVAQEIEAVAASGLHACDEPVFVDAALVARGRWTRPLPPGSGADA